MAGNTTFSTGRRWGIFLSVIVSMLAVGALVFMANYLSVLYPIRMNWNKQMNMSLSPQSRGLVASITNDVKVTIYFDREEPIYKFIKALMDEYNLANPRISVRSVDYKRDAAASQQLLIAYKQYLSSGDKDLVIFECNGRVKAAPGRWFGQYGLEAVAGNGEQKQWRQPLKSFDGEKVVSATLLNITSDKPFKAYFLRGHGEHRLDSTESDGYAKFLALLAMNNIESTYLPNILDTNEVPADCNLLIAAGPSSPLSTNELVKINKYLNQGGHLFALLTLNSSTGKPNQTGLELLLAEWGVEVGRDLVRDPDNTTQGGDDLIVNNFDTKHPIANSMQTSRLQLIRPREVGKTTNSPERAAAPKVTELAWTSAGAYLGLGTKPAGRMVPLAVAVEKAAAPAATAERGVTRIVTVGDSYFLDCQMIDTDNNNKDFAQNAINWLLDQKQVMAGVGPHPVREYTVVMTHAEMRTIQWLFLVMMPGGVMLVGMVVWWRRRH